MEKTQVMDRVLSNMSGVPGSRFHTISNLSEEDMQKIDTAATELEEGHGDGEDKSKLYLLQIPYQTTVSAIRRQIDKHIETFKPELVVIDYIDNMSPDKSYKDRHDREISDMLQSLRQMGKVKDFAILSGAQLGREALKRIRKTSNTDAGGVVNSEDIRGAHTYSTDADYIWAQVPCASQPSSLLEIYVVKARNGKKVFADNKFKALLEVYPETSTIKSSESVNILSMGNKMGIFHDTDDSDMAIIGDPADIDVSSSDFSYLDDDADSFADF
jgi:replicative DNA helicase